MYHRFCGLTGRVVASSGLTTPLAPLRPIVQKSIPAVTYDSSVKFAPINARGASSQEVKVIDGVPYAPMTEKMKKLQEKFQKDDGVDVHLKGGPMDVVLYRFTQALAVTGGGFAVYYITSMVFAP